ncbi:adenosylcobinamide-GDP ribazoletransferase [Rhodosalinus halophilus]|uniref:Adenosylcobinamide-GDP ribazoletransferase n=1 Tax=Rhodosalinus halophilus TaxID=2259333 RepID=A0A365U6N0_9RHOB|nr:adenosylcobinamide-GDP ribazoletransferase [Rhodosalinus halophilus]RBI83898.1 adenosylcobinamide-GDP ribazoletransferase [Rhodosalinus halophilus]
MTQETPFSGWRDEIGVFALAVQFLTRLPVPQDLAFSEGRLLRATRYYPLVGLLVGAIGAGVLLTAAMLLPWPVAVLLSMAATLLATGAFHEDGLADAADGLGGGLTRERALEIMRDSRIGTYGALALGMALALKFAALAAFAPADAAALLILGHGISRYAPVAVVARHPYARETGAKFTAPSVSAAGHRAALATTLALAAALALALGPGGALAALAGAALLAALVARRYLRRLGGYTGDCLGATQQMAELGLYLGALAWL